MTVVVDASLVVAALVQKDADGQWAERLLRSNDLVAPHLMPWEAANILRRAVLQGEIDPLDATRTHAEMLSLPIDLFPYQSCALRAWKLRSNLTAYDAWYVAIADSLEAPLATLDLRLARANGPRCAFSTPSGQQGA